jgi:hypothetical protein
VEDPVVDFGEMWWRGGIILLLFGLGIVLTIAGGWAAAIVYGFFLVVAVAQAACFILWGRIAQWGGGWYYDRQLRGRR